MWDFGMSFACWNGVILKGEFSEFMVDLLVLLVTEKWWKNSWELSLELGEPKSTKIVLIMVVLHTLMVEWLVLFNGKHNIVFGLTIEVIMWSKVQKGDEEMPNNVIYWLGDSV